MLKEHPEHHPCRRCSECQGCEHHWLENGEFEEAGDPEYECKHCPAKCRAVQDDNGFDEPDGNAFYEADVC